MTTFLLLLALLNPLISMLVNSNYHKPPNSNTLCNPNYYHKRPNVIA